MIRLEGGYDRYREWKDDRDVEAREQARAHRQRARSERSQGGDSRGDPQGGPNADTRRASRPLTWKEEREAEALEARIAELEGERSALEALLADPDFYSGGASNIRETTARFDRVRADLEDAFLRWADLEERRN